MSNPEKDGNPIAVHTLGGTTVSFSGDYKDAVFGKTLNKFTLPDGWGPSGITDNWDPHNQYNQNNYGYRGPDFSSESELLTAGCSVTYGLGIPEKGTWSKTLGDMLGMSYVNLSAPAASVEWIINSIYRYIDTFGKPKLIVALFPDLTRGESVVDVDAIKPKVTRENLVQQNWDDDKHSGVVTYQRAVSVNDLPKYLKRPYYVEDIKTEAESIYSAIVAVRNLESYCRSSDIKLVWSTWASDFCGLTEILPDEYKFNNFHYLRENSNWLSQVLAQKGQSLPKTSEDPEGIVDYKNRHNQIHQSTGCPVDYEEDDGCVCFDACHFDLISQFPDSFHLGTDRWKSGDRFNAHPGVHRHIHFAEDFRERIAEVYGI